MSAGAFLKDGKYEDDNGVVHPIRIQPETLSLTLNSVVNAAPAGAVASGVASAKVSGSRRGIGYNARLVRFSFVGPTFPPGYLESSSLTLPVLTGAAFAAYGKSTTGTYTLEGTAYPIAFAGKTPEKIV